MGRQSTVCLSMKSAKSPLLAAAYQRPKKLYRYSQRQWLERALQLGEFRLRPAMREQDSNQGSIDQILPFGAKRGTAAATAAANYLTLSLATDWDEKLFEAFPGADCCLVIHDAEEFGERIHRAAQRLLPSWAGIDAAISYGMPSPLGAAFSKPKLHASEKEWLFAWRPTHPMHGLNPVVIQIGSIEGIAELRQKTA
jgi:hypothetical protein